MISNEFNLFKRVWIVGMDRLCLRGMNGDLTFGAAGHICITMTIMIITIILIIIIIIRMVIICDCNYVCVRHMCI